MAKKASQRKHAASAAETIQHDDTRVVAAKVDVPLGVVGDMEFLSRHVETRFTTVEQRMTFKRLLRGLQHAGAKTKAGKPVNRPGDVMRWLMENVAVDGAAISEPD